MTAHLHPQAQIAVAKLIDGIKGQHIVTTHSPHLASEASLTAARLFRRAGAKIEVVSTSGLSAEDVIKARRLVERPYGQILFARLVLVADGATERAALPVFGRVHWNGTELEGKCVSVVDPESLSNAAPLIKVLDDLGIPWLIFADGDEDARRHLTAIGHRIGRSVDSTSPEVTALPEGTRFEQYLLDEGLRPEMEAGISDLYGPSALEDFRAQGNNAQLNEDKLVLQFLKGKKGSYGAAVAESIVSKLDNSGHPTIPLKVKDLLEKADRILETGSP